MKGFICLILAGIIIDCAQAQLLSTPTPTWKVTLKVVDDAAQPVSGAKVVVGYMFTNQITGLTDRNGVFVASHRDKSFGLGFLVTKEGYYMTRREYEMGWAYQYDKNKAKWNPMETIVLRKFGNPIPMYARRKESGMELQKEDEPIGLSLIHI